MYSGLWLVTLSVMSYFTWTPWWKSSSTVAIWKMWMSKIKIQYIILCMDCTKWYTEYIDCTMNLRDHDPFSIGWYMCPISRPTAKCFHIGVTYTYLPIVLFGVDFVFISITQKQNSRYQKYLLGRIVYRQKWFVLQCPGHFYYFFTSR